MTADELDFCLEMVDLMPSDRPPTLISEYIEGRRRMPSDTPFPGLWENARTPYLVEPMDNMSPYSAIKETYLLKGAQFGATAMSENVMGYWMDANPTSILYVSATQEMLEKWVNKRLEPMITSLGFRHKMSMADVLDNKKSRRGGDRAMSKQFMGGSLDMGSAQSAPSVQSDSKRVLILDEVDRAPVGKGKENWIENAKARTIAWANRAKILGLSTPDTEEASNIWRLYEDGDRRHWFMPCPHCGQTQTLSMTLEEFPKRMIPVRDDKGYVVDVAFICKHCNQRILDSIHKDAMICKGEWVPEGTPAKPNVRSYHMPTAMSTIMRWVDLYAEYEKFKGDPSGIRSFVNLYLGLPFREAGRKPKIDNTMTLRGAYKQGLIPEGVIYLTAGVDVQTGKDARLEVLILGHGIGYRTWVIDYRVFMGDTTVIGPDTPDKPNAWGKLDKWGRESKLTYQRGDRLFPVQMVFIDSGDGNVTATVYQFCQGWWNTFAIKGENSIKSHEKKVEEGDRAGKVSEVAYRHSQIGESGQWFYRIGTNHYKKIIYQNLEVERVGAAAEHLQQNPRFMDFPEDITDEFFTQLLGEELRDDGSYHPVKAGQRVEALDCTVYAMCAGDVWLHTMTRRAQEKFKKQRPEVSMSDIEKNITPYVQLVEFARQVGVIVDAA